MSARVPLVSASASALDGALAELRAIPAKANATEETAASPACCTGDRRGYQWHQRTGNLPACQASAEAAAEYMRGYYDRSGRYAGRVQRHREVRKAGAR